MNQKLPKKRRGVQPGRILKTLLLGGLALLGSSQADASHYRYGLVTATRTSETSTTVTYTLNASQAWALNNTNGSPVPFTKTGGNTGSVSVPFTFATDPSGQWTNGVSAPTTVVLNKSATPTRITYSSCCKISTLVNNANGNWDQYIILNTNTGGGSSPTSTMPAIINVPDGASSVSFSIPASDPDPGSTLTYGVPSFATGTNLAGETEPLGLTVNPTTGVATVNTSGASVSQNQLYNAMVTVTDNNGNQIMLDFIIKIVGPSNPPVFDYSVTPQNNAVYNVIAGQNLTFPIKATDADLNSTVGFTVSGLPSFITTSNFSPALPNTQNSSSTVNFSWTPATAQIGSQVVLNFVAQDNVGVQSSTSVTINVVAEPAPSFISPTPAEASLRQIETGVAFSDTIKAQSSLGSNVSIAFATGIPSGASFSPSIPTTGANPGMTILNWTPTAADFGLKTLSYQATISALPTIFSTRSYSLIVNTPPAFSSTPALIAYPGVPYSYNVTVSDPNIPYGDNVDIVGSTLPSWLTLTSTGNGTATLHGTPSASDFGNNVVDLEAEDTYHHGNPSAVSQSFTINVACPTIIAYVDKRDVSCYGRNNGNIEVNGDGSSTDYTYSIDNGASFRTSNFFTGLVPGTYAVIAKDANNCTSAVESVTISQPMPLTVTANTSNVLCNGGSNGALDITATGGTAAYTYNWGAKGTNEDLSNLSVGTYTVTVTDRHECATTTAFTVSQPAALTASTTATDALCNGGSTGAADLTVTGGTANYTYLWSNTSTSQDLSGVAAGSYTVTVTDANGCVATSGATIGEPAALTVTEEITNASCFGRTNGRIDISTAGGTMPYAFSWSNNSTNESINGLSAGNYNLTVTDAHGCIATGGYTVSQPAVLAASTTQVNVSCNGGTNGSIDLSVNGGTPGYSYLWNNNGTSQDRSGLGSGTYTVTVKDAHECVATAAVTITQPAALSISNTSNNVSCHGGANGSVDITPAGGQGTYTYNWSNNATTQDVSGLTAGTYTVTVADGADAACTTSQTYTVAEPTVLTLTGVTSNVSCNGGTNGAIDITATGGTAGYTYNWSNNVTTEDRTGLGAGTYALVATDANGCTANGSYTISEPQVLAVSAATTNVSCNGGANAAINITATGGTTPYSYNWGGNTTTEDRTGLTAGSYTVNIQDAKGCTTSGTYAITQPSALTLSGSATNTTCNGGSNGAVTIVPGGGTTPYSYTWNGVSGSQNLSGKPAGSYNVVVTDAKGCAINGSYTINQPTMLVVGAITPSTTYVTGNCSAYTIYLGYGAQSMGLSVSPTGGSGTYSYLWTPSGATTASVTVSPTSTSVYNVTVTDANGCTSSSNTGTNGGGFTVRVRNVRCGANNDKVSVCHNNGNVICISPSAVPAHMTNHGDCLGECGTGNARGTAPAGRIDLEGGNITVYPNPAHGKINVALKEIGAPYRSVQITDVNGRVITNREITGDVHSDVISVDISGYATGMYIIRAVTDEGASLSKFSVE